MEGSFKCKSYLQKLPPEFPAKSGGITKIPRPAGFFHAPGEIRLSFFRRYPREGKPVTRYPCGSFRRGNMT